MGVRPAKCYRSPRKGNRIRNGASGHARKLGQQRAYTRIAKTVPRRNYIGAEPANKIRQYNMGNPLLKYDTVVDLTVNDSIDIRDNCLESTRQSVNRKLVKDLGKDGYFMKLRTYPSHILRENKQAQGAGADRVSQGMTLAFGIPIGRASRLRSGQPILSALCFDTQKEIVKAAMMRAKSKVPCTITVKFHTNIFELGTLPSKAIEEKVVEVVKTDAAAVPGAEGAPALDAAGKPIEAGKGAAAGAKAPAGKDAAAGKADAGKGGKAPDAKAGKK